ncbi:SGNH/GDSL hydrolase family protein [Clostridium botulinum]|uniref:SGNH/GDSL hydrolase family protein n=1 Tax=Clostridium botulinum TaxID=1491 RepID=UPI0006579AF8|nr:SGNH/GDSL hydrolase family protein [Clostridium botulinum]KLU74191.1 phage pre-neck appendage-like protein [Clostridium botulinum V891]
MDKIFNLKIDTKNKNINEIKGLKQDDSNAILNITLLQNSLALDLTNCTVRINFLREDERILLYMADIVSVKEGRVSIKLSPEVLEKAGLVKADISVFDSNLFKITSATFNLKVEKTIYNSDTYFTDKDLDLMQQEYIREKQRQANENVRKTNEDTRNNNEIERLTHETQRQTNENTRIKAENTRAEEWNNIKKDGNNLKNTLDNAITNANKSKDNLQNTINNADKVRKELNVSNYVSNSKYDAFEKKVLDENKNTNTQLEDLKTKKADQAFVDAQIATIISGAPKGTYPTLNALNQAYQKGADGVFLVLENGHWYYWNSSTSGWTDGGIYQATEIQNGSITTKQCNFIENDMSDNLLNLNKITKGFLTDGGKIEENSNYFTTDFIEATMSDVVRYTYDINMGTNNKVYCFDKDKKLYSTRNGELDDTTTYRVVKLTDANIKYIRISFNNKNFNSAMIFLNKNYSTKYQQYYKKSYLNNEFYLNNTQKNEVENIVNSNCLNNKIITWNGDSICAGDGWRGGYPKIISERNNMISENIAVGGGSITAEQYHSDNHRPRHWVARTIEKMRSDADYAILEGGVNDYSLKVPFGEITKDFTSKLDDTTFCGAFESMLKQLILKFQGKKIGYILVHRIWDNNSNFDSKWYPAILEMCNKWGVPVCDLYKNCPSLKLIDELKNRYTNNKDGWHPNEEGYRKYYVDKIENWMKTL